MMVYQNKWPVEKGFPESRLFAPGQRIGSFPSDDQTRSRPCDDGGDGKVVRKRSGLGRDFFHVHSEDRLRIVRIEFLPAFKEVPTAMKPAGRKSTLKSAILFMAVEANGQNDVVPALGLDLPRLSSRLFWPHIVLMRDSFTAILWKNCAL